MRDDLCAGSNIGCGMPQRAGIRLRVPPMPMPMPMPMLAGHLS
ncbi:hypothetical protein ABZ114_03235 [Streptomyces albidoflavus]